MLLSRGKCPACVPLLVPTGSRSSEADRDRSTEGGARDRAQGDIEPLNVDTGPALRSNQVTDEGPQGRPDSAHRECDSWLGTPSAVVGVVARALHGRPLWGKSDADGGTPREAHDPTDESVALATTAHLDLRDRSDGKLDRRTRATVVDRHGHQVCVKSDERSADWATTFSPVAAVTRTRTPTASAGPPAGGSSA